MRINIVTALPGLVEGPLQHSILHRGQQKGLVEIYVHDLRNFATGKHRRVDDYPFGGGAGMVLKPEPIFECIESLQKARAKEGEKYDEIIYLSPDGEVLNQPMANKLSMYKNILLLAGHYKGIDQRVRDTLITKEISVGDYVLSGGELPALVLVDALVRIIPGVIGDAVSALSDAFQEDRLDAPAYTRPAEYRKMKVPDVLLSGNHKKIEAWREEEKLRKTRQLRPDLLSSDDDIDR